MANVRRPLLLTEWGRIRDALPDSHKPILDSIEYIRECCWNCEHYDGYEGHAGTCLEFDTAIPNDQRSVIHIECFSPRLTPF